MTAPDSRDSVEILPCPFCGSEAERIDFGPGSGDNEGGSCIACTKCQASGPVEFGYKENFVANWNRRALARGPQQAGGEDAFDCKCVENARRAHELQAEVARLQRALNFWLPTTAQVDPAFAERVCDDAMLLMGYTGDGDALCYHDQATHPAEAALREAKEALSLIAAPQRPDGTWNRDRAACQHIAERASAALNGGQDDA